MPATKFESLEEISALMSHFETGDPPLAKWDHRAHLIMAFWYLSRMDEPQALERIRAGILEYNVRNGTPNTPSRGYHETLTRFWVRVVANFLNEADPESTPLETANRLVEEYAGRGGLWRDYYSFDLMLSRESRRRWIEPDRKTL
jgi:hypothetical protein